MTIVTAVAAIGTLTFLLATLLLLAERKLHVEQDARIDVVYGMLPRSNCGACGAPGCQAFAEALLRGDASPAGCTVSSAEERQAIARYLGVATGAQIRRVARLACAGGSNVARNRAHYTGTQSCVAAAQVAGGGKGCFWGCLGLGDCARSCTFDAIIMNQHALPVVAEDNCTACGDCVASCPKELFSLQAADQRLWVNCNNREHGDAVLAHCEVGCTACGRCALDATDGSVAMVQNLPLITDSCAAENRQAIERCPTGAIVWLDQQHGALRGATSTPVLRHEALPDAPS